MSLAIVYSRASVGISAPLVTVEAHLSNGLPKFFMVGLPETAVKESKDRVRSAIINSGFRFPPGRVTINLGPADLPKESGRYDLPIAMGILAATGQIPTDSLQNYEFSGELALSGALCSTPGMLPFALQTRKAKRKLIIPQNNLKEASLCGDIELYGATHLNEVCQHLLGIESLSAYIPPASVISSEENYFDLSEVKGQAHARRALEIAAAGGHSLLMVGPPGTGKTMLASRLPGILPSLSYDDALEAAAILSISHRGFQADLWKKRPFRAPHHTASMVALVGGGKPPKPGEISLAHHGILFLDELPEFHRHVLEALREPLESGTITISRAGRQAEFPAKFQLIAAMNPCPCGYLTDPRNRCRCTPEQIYRYRHKLSGPLLDRIDMHIEVPALPQGLLTEDSQSEESSVVRKRVELARDIQLQRQETINNQLSGKKLEKYAKLSKENRTFLDKALQRLNLSARAYHRILRVARTIADLTGENEITLSHLSEALSYRRLEKNET